MAAKWQTEGGGDTAAMMDPATWVAESTPGNEPCADFRARWELAANRPETLGRQVGESPYRETTIQPWEVWASWELDPWEASILKRLQRYRRPGGKGLEDLEKMAHELEYLIERERRRIALDAEEAVR